MRLHTAVALVAALFLASCVFGHTVALRLLLLGSGLVLTAVVVYQRKESISALPPIWLPFALWGAWAAASIAWSVDPAWSRKEWQNEVFYTGAGLWICYVGAQTPNAPRIFAVVLAGAAVLSSVIAMSEFSYGLEFYSAGWHGGPGDHSSALLVLMPGIAIGAWYASRARWPLRRSLAIVALAALLVASAYTTLNRTVWLAFAVEFAVLGVLLLARSPLALRSARGKLVAAGFSLVVVVVCGAVLFSVQAERELVGAKALDQDHRLQLWPEIARHIEERPLAGHGYGRGVLRKELQQTFGKLDRNLWHAHNLFLEALLQLGVPGFVLLLVLLGAVAREGWRKAREAHDAVAASGIVLLAVLAGMLARNMTDSLLIRQNALLFWGVVGLLLAGGQRRWRASS